MAGAVVIQGLRDLSRRGPGYRIQRGADRADPLAGSRLPDARAAGDRGEAPARRDPARCRVCVSVGITQNAFLPKFSYQTLIKVKDLPTPDDQPHTVQYRRVSPDYFKTMQIKTIARARVHR